MEPTRVLRIAQIGRNDSSQLPQCTAFTCLSIDALHDVKVGMEARLPAATHVTKRQPLSSLNTSSRPLSDAALFQANLMALPGSP
jgi:hypothetical protein